MIQQGSLQNRYTSTGKHSGYEIELQHKGLNEIKHLFARDTDILEGKIHNQTIAWGKKWQKHLERKETEKNKFEKIAKSELATEKTEMAKQALIQIENILSHTLNIDDAVDWNSIKNTTPFKDKIKEHGYIQFNPQDGCPQRVKKLSNPIQPAKSSFFTPIPFLKKLLGQKQKILNEQQNQYNDANRKWEKQKKSVSIENKRRDQKLEVALNNWKKKEEKYLTQQKSLNQKVNELRSSYNNKNEEAIEEYCEIVLNNSQYPDSFPKDFDLQYKSANNMLLIDYVLPEPIPKIKQITEV